jgi:predicted transglutaminase-like cysteine proteinase
MPLGPATMAPRGFLAFCAHEPKECGMDATKSDPKDAERSLMSQQWEMVFAEAPKKAQPPEPDQAPSKNIAEISPSLAVASQLTPRRFEGRVADMLRLYQPAPRPIILAALSYEMSSQIEFAFLPSRRSLSDVFDGRWEQQIFQAEPPNKLDTSLPTSDARDAGRLQHIREVNDRINAAISPATDVQAFGVNDVWTLPLRRGGRALGNCKHYVLEKRRALVDAGVPSADMSIAIVRTVTNEMHAVLLVKTSEGEVVLDNLTRDIRGWRDVNYTWLERQKPGEPLAWVRLDAPDLRATKQAPEARTGL